MDFDPTDFDGPGGDDPLMPEGEEGERAPQDQGEKKDAILFVVDCTSNALKPLKPDGRCLLAEALATAASLLKTKVITTPDDKVGVLLYGVKEKQNPNNFDGIRLLFDLDRPSAQRIKQLEEEARRSPKQMEERYGCGKATPVSDVFWTSTTIFNLGANQNQFDSRIFLFTCNDAPAASADEVHAARTRVQDLMDMDVKIDFFPLRFEEKDFSIERFWGALLPVDPTDYVSRASGRLELLERRVRMRVHRKRTLQRLTFYVCAGVEASVSIFVTLLEAKIPAPIYLLNENNKPLKAETKQICEQTGALLHPVDDIATYVEVAGTSRIQVSRQEAMEAKHFGDPGLRLLGFKPSKSLEDHHRIFHAYFVYPNE
ncbi:X-ray repair cross-complementing protein 5 (5'-deoxyribose-5-phosphate lyase Ku70) (5'-dRP/AP lyase Ku70) (ATP-dependent DNA helicase 2 subunit 1) (ATP-dependent DNA helicase II 70 kDa subunit) (DNA repair protein XRCC6) (Ku autoantigen protein p70 homolog) (Ku70), partial [Durusdinium trenchii]